MSYPGYYGAQYPHQGVYTPEESDDSPIDDLFSPAEPRFQHYRHYPHGGFAHYDGDGYSNNNQSYETYTTRGMPVYDHTVQTQNYGIHPRSDSKSTISSHRRHDSSAPSSPDSRYYLPASHSHTSSMIVNPSNSASRGSQLTPLECRHAPVHHSTANSGGRPYCMHPDCLDPATGQPVKSFSRKADVSRHMKSQHEPKYIDCPLKRCNRKGDNGFTRHDHLIEHQRQYHGQDLRKRGTVGRTSGGGGVEKKSGGRRRP